MTSGLLKPSSGQSAIVAATAALRAGRLAIIPTETVYGVAANGASPEAVKALTSLVRQSSPPNAPITTASTWHAPAVGTVLQTLHVTQPLHLRLFHRLAPGPIRFLVQKPPTEVPAILKVLGLPPEVVERGGEFSVRVPDHPIAHSIIEQAGGVVIADRTSVFGLGDGHSLPENIAELAAPMGISAIVDDGPTRLGKPSTSIRLKLDGSYEVIPGGLFDERYIRKKVERVILFVCTGNTCRSPMSAAIAQDVLVRTRSPIPTRVLSAGVSAVTGEPMTREAQAALLEMKIDPGRHRSHELGREQIQEAEVIYGMTKAHVQAILDIAPSAAGKVFALDPEGNDVPDPIGASAEEYRSTAKRLMSLIERRIAELNAAS
jgi:protein-tyrosine phosphatase